MTKILAPFAYLKCIISMSIGEILANLPANLWRTYCITYRLKFVNVIAVIYISLFSYDFISPDATELQKYFKGNNHCPRNHYH